MAEQPSFWNIKVRRYFSIEVIEASVGLTGTVQVEGSITTGASALLPLNLNVPPKFCGETFVTLSSRSRAPNLQKCLRCAMEVLFCNSKLFCVYPVALSDGETPRSVL